jgi:hypothetical protein
MSTLRGSLRIRSDPCFVDRASPNPSAATDRVSDLAIFGGISNPSAVGFRDLCTHHGGMGANPADFAENAEIKDR